VSTTREQAGLERQQSLRDENQYAAFIGRITGNPQRMAIYEHLVDRENKGHLERIYLHLRMIELDEVAAFIRKQGGVFRMNSD
jgi:hypothetical protein